MQDCLRKERARMAKFIRSSRDVWVFTLTIGVIATTLTQLILAGIYLVGGPEAFHMRNAIIMCAIAPMAISCPITYCIARMSQQLNLSQIELQRLADTDPLTQLPNRRVFFRAAELALKQAARRGATLSLLIIDADHFKELNDSYGHTTGDKALVAIAGVLKANFRPNDLISRVGGEEFAVLLMDINIDKAEVLAQRVVDKVAASPLSEPNAIIEYSVSCGIADTQAGYELQSLFKAADDAMYTAKERGRNRVALQDVA